MFIDSVPKVDEVYVDARRVLELVADVYSVRRAEHRDIPSVVRINRLCLPENYSVGFFEDLLRAYGNAFFVAVHREEGVVGYVMCRVEVKKGFFSEEKLRSLHIVSIAVMPKHRRKKLGYALMAYAMNSGKWEYDCHESYLEVRVSNEPAINLYKRLGYSVITVIPQYYLDGEDAYLMARPI
ncbi:MAG: GNAT family N-acetyltransferase [Sulfolobales archaeon]|nr:GNAT family N-acetyltransferase [Sulfolobales archaeon]MCX8199298.1 GNAT family N-acetyltransferase [Sulfolobales archaeon]MDW8170388.1 N-acetyltransferase [Desulfurococcaceae archaeon]